jgi:hypothetical protein
MRANVESGRQRFTIITSKSSPDRRATVEAGTVPSPVALLRSTAALRQPDYLEMLTNLADPTGWYFNSSCRDMLAIWFRPFYLRLMLAAWKDVPEREFAAVQARLGYDGAVRWQNARKVEPRRLKKARNAY